MALVITRRPGEAIVVRCDGWTSRIYVVSIEGNVVRLAIEAPSDHKILREELVIGPDGRPAWSVLLASIVEAMRQWWGG